MEKSSDDEEEIVSEAVQKDASVGIKILESCNDDEGKKTVSEAVQNNADVGIKILESCSIDVSQFNSNTSSTPKPDIGDQEVKPVQKPTNAPKDTEVVVIDDSDEDDDMPIIKFKRVPIPLKGSFVCPFCTSGYREEATLLAHLVSSHFREKLAFMFLVRSHLLPVLRLTAASDTGLGRVWGTTWGGGTGRSSLPWSDKYSQDLVSVSMILVMHLNCDTSEAVL